MEVIIDGIIKLFISISNVSSSFMSSFVENWIPLATLISVIVGFVIFNSHTKKLEEVQLFQELQKYYTNLKLFEHIQAFKEKYNLGNQRLYIDAYTTYLMSFRQNNVSLSNHSKRILELENNNGAVYNFVSSIYKIICTTNKLYIFLKRFKVINKDDFASVFYKDITDIDVNTIHFFLECYEGIRRTETIEDHKSIYHFEDIEFSPKAVSNYKRMVNLCVKYESKIEGYDDEIPYKLSQQFQFYDDNIQ